MATQKTNSAKQAEDFVKNAFENFSQSIGSFSSFTKDAVDAVVKSSTATSKNVEELVSEVLNCTKSNVETCVSVAKDIAGARSFEQIIAIQTEQSKKYFENYVSQMTKISEICMNISKEATAPINEHASTISEKFMKKAA